MGYDGIEICGRQEAWIVIHAGIRNALRNPLVPDFIRRQLTEIQKSIEASVPGDMLVTEDDLNRFRGLFGVK